MKEVTVPNFSTIPRAGPRSVIKFHLKDNYGLLNKLPSLPKFKKLNVPSLVKLSQVVHHHRLAFLHTSSSLYLGQECKSVFTTILEKLKILRATLHNNNSTLFSDRSLWRHNFLPLHDVTSLYVLCTKKVKDMVRFNHGEDHQIWVFIKKRNFSFNKLIKGQNGTKKPLVIWGSDINGSVPFDTS